ncbi:hypothetical protein QQP08_018687 [Theobroma cacao]|nr:hypothetical protein QQP08_018687 [Theobroma cacao]
MSRRDKVTFRNSHPTIYSGLRYHDTLVHASRNSIQRNIPSPILKRSSFNLQFSNPLSASDRQNLFHSILASNCSPPMVTFLASTWQSKRNKQHAKNAYLATPPPSSRLIARC